MAAAERRWYRLDQFVSGNSGPRSSRGPFCCPRVPVSGLLEIPAGKGGELVRIEEKIFFPLTSGIRARAVIVDLATNYAYQVVYVQRRSSCYEAWVKSAKADA